jgi:hypothetical protein
MYLAAGDMREKAVQAGTNKRHHHHAQHFRVVFPGGRSPFLVGNTTDFLVNKAGNRHPKYHGGYTALNFLDGYQRQEKKRM